MPQGNSAHAPQLESSRAATKITYDKVKTCISQLRPNATKNIYIYIFLVKKWQETSLQQKIGGKDTVWTVEAPEKLAGKNKE